MSELGKVLGSLLRDIAHTQDISNRYSVKLSQEYHDDELLRHFPIPNAILTEIKIKLKFAIQEVVEEDETVRSSVIVESAKLAELPPETISSVKFKSEIRDFKWVREEDGEDELEEREG